jgi:hypothetical protein
MVISATAGTTVAKPSAARFNRKLFLDFVFMVWLLGGVLASEIGISAARIGWTVESGEVLGA